MATAIVTFQSVGHRRPQDPPSNTEGGAPYAPLYFLHKFSSAIFSISMSMNLRSFETGPPAPRWNVYNGKENFPASKLYWPQSLKQEQSTVTIFSLRVRRNMMADKEAYIFSMWL